MPSISRFCAAALALAALGSAGPLFASGLVQVAGERNASWVLTLVDPPTGASLSLKKPDGSGSIMLSNPPYRGTLASQVQYALVLEGLKKDTKSLTFRLSKTNEEGYILLSAEVGDANAAYNPVYKPMIKRIVPQELALDASGRRKIKPTNWEDMFSWDDLKAGDLLLYKKQKLAELHD